MCEGWLSSRCRNEESSAVSLSFAMPGILAGLGLQRQGELRRVLFLLVEAGHAHPEEADRARRVEGPEELESERCDHLDVVGGSVDRGGAGVRREVVEAHLDPD